MIDSIIGLLGDGSQADETEEFAAGTRVLFRAVSRQFLPGSNERIVDISTLDTRLHNTPVVAAVGPPGLRRELVSAWGGTVYRTIISAGSSISSTVSIGPGCTIAPGAIITSRTSLGAHVIVNIGATVSHRCVLGDFVTISPGVNVGGNCTIGDGVFLGIGSTVAHGVSICSGAVVGAGAVVTEDILEQGIYVGVPARRVRLTDNWLFAL